MSELTQEELKEVLDYNSDTGIFRWKNVPLNRMVSNGDIAGCQNHGYVRIKIRCRSYEAHRLAWLYVTGH